jgi:hypothetical protein
MSRRSFPHRYRLGRRAPDRLELSPIEAGVGIDVVGVQLQDLLAVALAAADEIGLRHFLSNSKLATMGIQRCHTMMSRPRVGDACNAQRCTADPGPPQTGTVPGLQRTTRLASRCAAPGTQSRYWLRLAKLDAGLVLPSCPRPLRERAQWCVREIGWVRGFCAKGPLTPHRVWQHRVALSRKVLGLVFPRDGS